MYRRFEIPISGKAQQPLSGRLSSTALAICLGSGQIAMQEVNNHSLTVEISMPAKSSINRLFQIIGDHFGSSASDVFHQGFWHLSSFSTGFSSYQSSAEALRMDWKYLVQEWIAAIHDRTVHRAQISHCEVSTRCFLSRFWLSFPYSTQH